MQKRPKNCESKYEIFPFYFSVKVLNIWTIFSEEDEFFKKVILITFWKVEKSHGGCERTFNEDTVIVLVTFIYI